MKTLRLRLAIWSGTITGVILLLYVIGDTFELYQDCLDYIDAEIVQSGEHYLATVAGKGGSMNFDAPVEAMILDDREYMTVLEVVSPSGVVFQRQGFRDALDEGDYRLSGSFETISYTNSKYRIGTVGYNGWVGTFAVDFEIVSEEIFEAITGFIIILPGVILAAMLGGWWIGRMALHPIRMITQKAEAITATELNLRLPKPDVNGEIARLVEVLNAMLARLESSFHQASRFTADASHQLRTPLTILQAEIDSALNSGNFKSEQQHVLMILMEEVQRLKTIVESLLILSRSDSGNLKLKKEPFDLVLMIHELVDDFGMMGESLGLRIETDIPDSLRLVADEILIRQCLANLFDNAVKYNRRHGSIGCRLNVDDECISFTICNDGASIEPEAQSRIFDRFFRDFVGSERGTKGFGLGLSLVQEISKAHGGTINLDFSQDDSTQFSLKLPKSCLEVNRD